MATHLKNTTKGTVFFITFTCFNWMNLIHLSNTYDYFNKWFYYLNKNNCKLAGYVIMPNHFHGLIYVSEFSKNSINTILANAKRFLAYEIIKGLKNKSQTNILLALSTGVSKVERLKGQKHKVFQTSSDIKECLSEKMIETKLDYIHLNPVSGKWRLSENFIDYPYSSAKFYERNTTHPYLSHYNEL